MSRVKNTNLPPQRHSSSSQEQYSWFDCMKAKEHGIDDLETVVSSRLVVTFPTTKVKNLALLS